MNRLIQYVSLTLVIVMLLGTVGTVAAQGPGGNDDRGRGNGPNADVLDAMAARFGLTTDELQAMFDEGMTPTEIAAQQGVELTELELVFLSRLDDQITRRVERRAERQAELAAALNITTDELQVYLDEGLTLPEIADQLAIDLTTIEYPLRAAFMDDADRDAAVAEAFGITVEALQAYQAEGLNLREIAEAEGVDLAEIELPFFDGRRGGNRGGDGPRGENGPGNGPNGPNGPRNGNGPDGDAPDATPDATETPAGA